VFLAPQASLDLKMRKCKAVSFRTRRFLTGEKSAFRIGLPGPILMGKLTRQVFPTRIRTFNQLDFLFPPPFLDFLLSSNRLMHIAELFEMYEPEDFVPRREPRNKSLAMLQHPLNQVPGNADIERSRSAGKNINKERSAHDWLNPS
jgi:hypothetical protein